MTRKEFKFKKKYGQNFIHDKNTINRIINLSELNKDILVIEIGAGSGVLTRELCKNAGFVISYEIDKDLKSILKKQLNDFDNYKIIFGDFLLEDIQEEIKTTRYKKTYIIANLPYYITTPIITKVINEKLNIEKLIVMMQKEVGDRFKAIPSTKNYNSLTIFINYFYNVTKIMDVSRNVFVPKPNVDSVVLSMIKRKENMTVKNEEHFFALVRNSFQFKRKTIKNNLRKYDLEKVEEILKQHNLSLSVRAEQLPIEIFIEISNNLI